MAVEDAKRLKALEVENNRLKRLLADAHLDIESPLKNSFDAGRIACFSL